MATKRIVIAGGNGQVGRILGRHWHGAGHSVTVLARRTSDAPWTTEIWDGKTAGQWVSTLEGSDVLVNLAGRSVNCRYTPANRKEIKQSRVQTTELLGKAVAQLASPPKVWLNASTATIYRHALDRPMDEASGELGGNEIGVPDTWRFSIDVAKSWEAAFFSSAIPKTRKIALRSAVILSPDRGGIFDVLLGLVRRGLGGTAGDGKQYVSWIHETDFVAAVDFLIARDDLEGVVNLSAPNPLPNSEFMRDLRKAAGIPIGLPAQRLMLEVGAVFLRTETELILKSRRVIPGRLLTAGFDFRFPRWREAAEDLVRRWRVGAEVLGWK